MLPAEGGPRTDIKHGCCEGAGCNRRTFLWLPAELCEKCLLQLSVEMGELFNADAFGGVTQ